MAALRDRIRKLEEAELGEKTDTLLLLVHTDLGETKVKAIENYDSIHKLPFAAFKKVVYLLSSIPRPENNSDILSHSVVTENGALKTD